MDINYDRLQRRYRAKVLCYGVVYPKALIRAIHDEMSYTGRAQINAYGVYEDGYHVADTSSAHSLGPHYTLYKDGVPVLDTIQVWRGGHCRAGFPQVEVEALEL